MVIRVKNKKGFTLVEILAVIVILAILMTTAGASVFSIIGESQKELLEEQIKNLGDTAITYVESKKYYLEKCPSSFDPNNITTKAEKDCSREILVSKLIEEGFFENKNDLCDSGKKIIVYKKNEGNYIELKSYIPENTCSY